MKFTNLNLFVVDDEKEVRDVLAMLFVARNYRVQCFDSGESFLERAETQAHGCVVLDVDMKPGMTGLQVFDELRRLKSPLVAILYSGRLNIPIATSYTKKGAFDCLEKGQDESILLECVQRAMEHSVEVATRSEKATAVKGRWNTLTPREKEVARLSRLGWPSALVADEIGISVRTAETHRLAVWRKLWVSNATELERLMRENEIE